MSIVRTLILERWGWGWGGVNLWFIFLLCQRHLHGKLYVQMRNLRQFIGQYKLILIIDNMHPHYFDTNQYQNVKQYLFTNNKIMLSITSIHPPPLYHQEKKSEYWNGTFNFHELREFFLCHKNRGKGVAYSLPHKLIYI